MTPDLAADAQAFGWLAGPAVLVLAAIYAHAWWRERHPKEPKQ